MVIRMGGQQGPPPDPLADISFAIRLQTHRPGSNVPIGLYQDTACTIPSTMDGDPIAAWRDELSDSGITLIQPDAQKQPILVFDGGVPTVVTDNVDDFLQAAFTLNQPTLVQAGFNQQTPGVPGSEIIFDGFNTYGGAWLQDSVTKFFVFAGSSFNLFDFIGNGTYGVGSVYFNGAASEIWKAGGINSVGNAGTGNMGGLTIGSAADGTRVTNTSYISVMIPVNVSDQSIVEEYTVTLLP